MTYPSARRTVLATGAAALLTGCSNYDDNGGSSSSQEASSTESSKAGASAGGELAKTTDIPVGGGKIFKDQKIVVTQPDKGEFKAFSAVCTHAGCTVGSVSDGTINCPCHGSKYRIADASVAHGPATRPLPAEKIAVEGNSIRQA
ncbi:Rieske (2Fe-2S) protein [Streptomyces sp. NPDC058371]|uniref:Rieske (2Fe-2S) protein n=1 Tax=Streptomyces sp. NPDC058371 TaxID=3346463 RepID=UPI00364CAB61